MSISHDLIVEVAPGEYDRLTTNWLHGPQAFVDGLCHNLTMPADHVVVVNLRGFVAPIDVVGGVDVTLEYPSRNECTHIDLPVGTQRLDGRTALSFMRSG